MLETHYTILDVHYNASCEEIEGAYRRMVRRCHPDLNPGDPDARRRFQRVQAAFDVLHNVDSRRQYDLSFEQNSARPQTGSLQLFAEAGAAKSGNPLVVFADETEMDLIRFGARVPGTQMQLYSPRSRLLWIQDWLLSSDFVLPLLVFLLFLGIQFSGTIFRAFTGKL
jgi:curved DNA-binding protein CbpA